MSHKSASEGRDPRPGRAQHYGDPDRVKESELFKSPESSAKDNLGHSRPHAHAVKSIPKDCDSLGVAGVPSHANGGSFSSLDIEVSDRRDQETRDKKGQLDSVPVLRPASAASGVTENRMHSWHGNTRWDESEGGRTALESDRQHRAVSELPVKSSSSEIRRREKDRQPSTLASSTDPVNRGHQDRCKPPFTFCPNSAVADKDNERYQSDGTGHQEHSREDSHLCLVYNDIGIYGVFDGHDGSAASEFARDFFRDRCIWWLERNEVETHKQIQDALTSIFKDTEHQWFAKLEPHILKKFQLQSLIPEDMKSYDAYQLYPDVINDLSVVCEKLAGGTTATVAIICNDVLYAANVGDSRVLLAYHESEDSTDLYCRQLTVDHDCSNKDELKRLEGLGLNAKVIIKSGRIGSHQCTRTLGDYSVKGGYQEFDILRDAKSEPVIADPFVSEGVELKKQHQFIAIMSDGVYKTYIEANDDPDGANCAICRLIYAELKEGLQGTAKRVLERLIKMHKEAYFDKGRQECRKRDDMTLIVRALQATQKP